MYRKGYGSTYKALSAKQQPRKNLLARWEFTNPKGYIVPNLIMARSSPYVNLIRSPEHLENSFTFGNGKVTDKYEIGPNSYLSATRLEMPENGFKTHKFSGLTRDERIFSVFVKSNTKEAQHIHLGLNDNFSLPLLVEQDWVRLSHRSMDSHSSLTIAGHGKPIDILLYQAQFENGKYLTEFQQPYLDIRLDQQPVVEDCGLKVGGMINLVGSDILALPNYTLYFVLKHDKGASKNKKQILFSPPNWYVNLQNADKQFGVVHAKAIYNTTIETDDGEYHVWALTYNGLYYNIYWDAKFALTQDYRHLKLDLSSICRLFEFSGSVAQGSLYAEYHDEDKIGQISRFLAGFTKKSRQQYEKIRENLRSGLQSLIPK